MTARERAAEFSWKTCPGTEGHDCKEGEAAYSCCRCNEEVIAAAEAESYGRAAKALDVVRAALDGMDRAGGDRDGMPECPWCRRGPDGEDHDADCELVKAREALAEVGALATKGDE